MEDVVVRKIWHNCTYRKGSFGVKDRFWASMYLLFHYMLSQVQQLSKLQYRVRSADALQRTTTGVQLSSEWPAVYIGNSFCKDQKIFPKTTTVHCFCDRFWPFLVSLWSTIIMTTKQYRLMSCEFSCDWCMIWLFVENSDYKKWARKPHCN